MTGELNPDAPQASRSTTQESGAAGGPPPGPSDDLQTEFDGEIVGQCEVVVEDFRAGRIDKPTAVGNLLSAFAFDRQVSTEENEAKRIAFQAFSQQLDQAEDGIRQAARRGVLPATGANSADGAPAVGPTQPDPDEVEQRTRTRRARITDDSDDDGGDERPRKKRQVDESLFPFGHSGSSAALSPELQKSLRLKANYMRDLALSKQFVLIQPDVPPLPDTLWNDVLKNGYVDFDKIYSSVLSVSSEPKQTLKFGELELEAAVPRVERHIMHHGNWAVAWARYEKAVVYAYPHRLDELREYSEYISGLFTSVEHGQDWKVINFDKAVRQDVGKSNALSLTDFGRFNTHFSKFLVGSGSGTKGSSPAEGSSRAHKSSSSEICRKYNEGRCSSKQCRYRHACTKCGERDHASTACPVRTAEKRK